MKEGWCEVSVKENEKVIDKNLKSSIGMHF